MVRVGIFEQLNSFVTLFVCRCSEYFAFLLRYYNRSVSVSGKASGVIYQNENWIGPSAELRIHHYLFGYNTIVVMLIVFVSS